jgi:hypothetical protein
VRTGEPLHFVQCRVPAGGADDDASAAVEHGGYIRDGGLGRGEVDDRIDAGEPSSRESSGVLILVVIDGADLVAALAGDLGDQAAGLSFA